MKVKDFIDDISEKISKSLRVHRQVDDILDNTCTICKKRGIFINGGREVTYTDLLLEIYNRNLLGKTKEERINNMAAIYTENLKLKKPDGHYLTTEDAQALCHEVEDEIALNHGIFGAHGS
jgi:hypothetical protein